jgi:hypothetical protein
LLYCAFAPWLCSACWSTGWHLAAWRMLCRTAPLVTVHLAADLTLAWQASVTPHDKAPCIMLSFLCLLLVLDVWLLLHPNSLCSVARSAKELTATPHVHQRRSASRSSLLHDSRAQGGLDGADITSWHVVSRHLLLLAPCRGSTQQCAAHSCSRQASR